MKNSNQTASNTFRVPINYLTFNPRVPSSSSLARRRRRRRVSVSSCGSVGHTIRQPPLRRWTSVSATNDDVPSNYRAVLLSWRLARSNTFAPTRRLGALVEGPTNSAVSVAHRVTRRKCPPKCEVKTEKPRGAVTKEIRLQHSPTRSPLLGVIRRYRVSDHLTTQQMKMKLAVRDCN